MAAVAGASGARSWLQARHLTWLTPERLRAATIALFIAALAVSTIGLSSSTSSAAHPRGPTRAAQQTLAGGASAGR
jgi:hypothetical protein